MVVIFFFNDTATTEIYNLSLHDALPISSARPPRTSWSGSSAAACTGPCSSRSRSEEHTSELQSPCNLVCRLLLEKKKTTVLDGPPENEGHSRVDHVETVPTAPAATAVRY